MGGGDEDPGDDMVDKVVAQPDSLTTQEPLSYVSLISHWPFFWLAICYNNQKLEFTSYNFSPWVSLDFIFEEKLLHESFSLQ